MTTVRPATATELPLLAPIEDAADRMFDDLFGPTGWPAATAGADRAAEPGFLLVATDGEDVVGFAHVLDLGGRWHLEQVAVDPSHQGRGHGAALLTAVAREVRRRGAREVTLRTYADVPWNGPWYARHGWVEVADPVWHGDLVAGEERMGLPVHGRRIAMLLRLP